MNDLYVACVRCGKPAAPHGEHHAVERGDGKTRSIGIGGSRQDHEHERIPLCRGCHRGTHDKEFEVVRRDGLIVCMKDGDVLSERAAAELTIHDLPLSTLSFTDAVRMSTMLDDDNLAYLWSTSDDDADRAVLKRAIISYVMWRRYGSWGKRWYDGAAEIIARYTGSGVSSRSVYNYRDVCEALLKVAADDPITALRTMGQQLLRQIGKAKEPAEEYGRALERRDAGEPPSAIKRDLLPPHEHEPVRATVCAKCKKVLDVLAEEID